MNRNLFFIVFILAISPVVLFSCNKGGGSSNNGYTNTPPPTVDPNAITISNMSFGSNSLTIKAGTTVTWTNADNLSHTVTADDNSFTSGDLGKDATFSHSFATVGTYNYHCKYHSMMTAKIIVN
jgi:plastocyanin